MSKTLLLFFTFVILSVSATNAQIIATIAGNGTSGAIGDGGPASAAEFATPDFVSVDAGGNVYVSDYDNCSIRKINTSGVISMVAGDGVFGLSGDGGSATAAQIDGPVQVSFDGSGNMYIADADNNRIRKVSAGIISTIAGSGGMGGFSGDGAAATLALLSLPSGVAVDAGGNVYIGDDGNDRIRKINTSGIITTVSGNGVPGYTGDGGPASAAKLHTPVGMMIDGSGDLIFADAGNHCIRKINTSGIITTIVGNGTAGYTGDGGPATAAELNQPQSVILDAAGNLYIADTYNNRIRRVNSSGIISTVVGTGVAGFSGDGGPATAAELKTAAAVAMDGGGNLYIADQGNDRIRKVGLSALKINNAAYGNEALKVYPNPVYDELFIEHAGAGAAIRIFNMVGQQVYSGVASSDKETMSIGYLLSGTYILQVTGTDGKRTIRTVVKE